MASRLTPLGLAAKWVMAPVAVGAVGFWAVSPFVGRLPGRVERLGRSAITKIEHVAEHSNAIQKPPTPPKSDGPAVDVKVQPATDDPTPTVSVVTQPPIQAQTPVEPKPKPRKRHRHRPEPKTSIDESSTATEGAAPDPEKADPASSGAISNDG